MNEVARVTQPKSPAPFSKEIIGVLRWAVQEYVPAGGLILDPFAGVGGVHDINDGLEVPYEILCVELEPEWAAQCAEKGPTWCGDFLEFKPPDKGLFDAVVTSPTYGNRMADHHDARDGSHRRTYKHYLGRDLTEGNSGAMQWGEDYRAMHYLAWRLVGKLTNTFILNIKDHPRKGKMQGVPEWHRKTIRNLGFETMEEVKVETPGYRFGENKEMVEGWEWVMVFQKQT